jgi:hypothetical protein
MPDDSPEHNFEQLCIQPTRPSDESMSLIEPRATTDSAIEVFKTPWLLDDRIVHLMTWVA